MPKVLVVEKNHIIEPLLQAEFAANHVAVEVVYQIAKAAEKLEKHSYDVLIWEAVAAQTEQAAALRLFDRLTEDSRRTYIIISANGPNGRLPLDRLKTYAHRTITHPIDKDELCAIVTEALTQQRGHAACDGRAELPIPLEFEGMLGASLPMREVFQRILDAASQDITVLITGETGTGKEMVAAAIHNRSTRKDGPYIAVNTGAIPTDLTAAELFGHEKGAYTGAVEAVKGRFEQAQGGSIFLDEISTINEKAQVSLLRVLENKTFRRVGGAQEHRADARVIAATNENLEAAVAQKKFREDLFYRLDVFHIHVPALRERPGGVTVLTNHFVPLFNAVYKKTLRAVAADTWQFLRSYSWPGNVRELKNVIQRAVLMAKGEELTPDLLPLRIRSSAPAQCDGQHFTIRPGMSFETVERQFILMTLATTKGNKTAAARSLGISRRALYDKLKKHHLL